MVWIWRLLFKAYKLVALKNKRTGHSGGTGHSSGGGGHKSSSLWDIVPDAIHTAISWLF